MYELVLINLCRNSENAIHETTGKISFGTFHPIFGLRKILTLTIQDIKFKRCFKLCSPVVRLGNKESNNVVHDEALGIGILNELQINSVQNQVLEIRFN